MIGVMIGAFVCFQALCNDFHCCINGSGRGTIVAVEIASQKTG